MSYTFTCDWCGERIESGGAVELRARAGDRSDWKGGWVAHYHGAGEDSCYAHIRDAIDLLREVGPDIESIPVLPREPSPDAQRAKKVGGTRTFDGIELSAAAIYALRSVGIETLGDAAEWSEVELLTIERVGAKTVRTLVCAMKSKGLVLRDGLSPEELGERLRGLREARRMDRAEVARAIDPKPRQSGGHEFYDVHYENVGSWERGTEIPKRKWLRRFADVFGIQIEELTAVAA